MFFFLSVLGYVWGLGVRFKPHNLSFIQLKSSFNFGQDLHFFLSLVLGFSASGFPQASFIFAVYLGTLHFGMD